MSLNLPIAELTLERGDYGLGFNIRGGTDSMHVPEDPGIFVSRLREDGTAFKDGRLKPGDKILSVNGQSIENVTHNEAVQIFITAGNTVKMKVQHGAYDYIVKRRAGELPAEGGGGMGLILGVIGLAVLIGIGLVVLKSQQQEG